jgi:hypothetical protein
MLQPDACAWGHEFMAMKFNPVSMDELINACMPAQAQPGVYYRQGRDIVLVSINMAEQHDGMKFVYVCFSGERVEYRKDISNALMIPLDELTPRFHIEGSAEHVEFKTDSTIGYYQEPALVRVDDQLHVLLKDLPEAPQGDPRFRRYRLMLNLATRQVVRLSPGTRLLVFDHVVMSGHLQRHGREASEQMAVLKLRPDDRLC